METHIEQANETAEQGTGATRRVDSTKRPLGSRAENSCTTGNVNERSDDLALLSKKSTAVKFPQG